jgi:hypothetical protein
MTCSKLKFWDAVGSVSTAAAAIGAVLSPDMERETRATTSTRRPRLRVTPDDSLNMGSVNDASREAAHRLKPNATRIESAAEQQRVGIRQVIEGNISDATVGRSDCFECQAKIAPFDLNEDDRDKDVLVQLGALYRYVPRGEAISPRDAFPKVLQALRADQTNGVLKPKSDALEYGDGLKVELGGRSGRSEQQVPAIEWTHMLRGSRLDGSELRACRLGIGHRVHREPVPVKTGQRPIRAHH